MAKAWPPKDPDEVLDYTWEPTIDEGDTISSIDLVKVSGDVVIQSESTVDNMRVVMLSGGTDGEMCEFYGRCVTTGGRTFEETIYLPIVASNTASPWMGQFLAAFPGFADVTPASIAFWKTEADRMLEAHEACLADGFDLATMLLTAHYLTLAGLGTGTEAQAAAHAAGFKRLKSGTLELERAETKSDGGSLASTSYGTRAWAMIRPCVAGPRVSATGTWPVYPGCV